MTVYVDPLQDRGVRIGRIGPVWCHMAADTSAELHAMAERIGMKPEWVQNPGTQTEHYDLVPTRRDLAVRYGAVELGVKEFVRRMREKPI